MVFIIGASSLEHTINCIPYYQRRTLAGRSYSIGGLSFNKNAKNRLKILQHLLTARGVQARTFKIVISHDVTNNTISNHRSNNFRATSVKELLRTLIQHRNLIEAVLYSRREGTPIISETYSQRISLSSRYRHPSYHIARTLPISEELRQTHPSFHLETKLLSTVWRNLADLTKL